MCQQFFISSTITAFSDVKVGVPVNDRVNSLTSPENLGTSSANSRKSQNLVLTCLYQNVRGLRTKINDVYQGSAGLLTHFDIFAMTETWLHCDVFDGELFDSRRFQVFRSDRNFLETGCRRGGGVLLALRQSLKASYLDISSLLMAHGELIKVDILVVTLKLNSKDLYILVVYVPPNCHSDVYDALFDLCESLHGMNGANILVLGDFNIAQYAMDHIVDNRSLTSLNNFMSFYDLTQYNNIHNHNERILDLVLSNNVCEVCKFEDVFLPVDDHHPVLEIKMSFGEDSADARFAVLGDDCLNFRRANFTMLYQEMCTTDWNKLNCFDVNGALMEFYCILNTLLMNHIPKKKAILKQYPDWFSGQLIRLIIQKNKLWKKYKSSQAVGDYALYKEIRTFAKSTTRKCYHDFVAKTESCLRNEPNKFWSFINSKKQISSLPSAMIYKDNTLTDPHNIVSAFADFFSASYIDSKNHSVVGSLKVNGSVNVFKITESDVLDSIKRLKPNMTMGPDLIPAFLIRDCSAFLCRPLCTLFNLILDTGIFPDCWKVSRITPVFKRGSKSDVTNYRPIAIMSNFAKLFEIIIHAHIVRQVNAVLIPEQHGFISGRSTVTNLLCKTQFLSGMLDRGSQVDVIYTDFSKAFDRLDHGILLQKLDNYGFCSKLVNLFRTYLSNRSQFVQYRGFKSRTIAQSSGVPQGSILGPLLFVIFLNDVVDDINVKSLIYADDLKLFFEIKSVNDCITLQNNLCKLDAWCDLNCLPLNAAKCNVMSFSRKINVIRFDYMIHNSVLERPVVIKDLGVVYDSKLSFIPHIESTVSSAYRALGFILRNSKDFTQCSTLCTLFSAFVRSKLEYASVIWAPIYKVHVQSLEIIQRKFLKFLSFRTHGVYPPRGFPQETLCAEFDYQSLDQRRSCYSVVFLHKILHNKIDCSEILSMIDMRVPRLSCRHQQQFILPRCRTNLMKSSPLYRMIRNYSKIESNLDILSATVQDIKKEYAL